MKIKNVDVYGLESSMVRSGYPMQTGEPCDMEYEVENLSYWINNGLKSIIKRLNYIPLPSNKTNIEYHRKTLNEIKEINDTFSIINIRDNYGNINGELIVDNIDLVKILSMKWNKSSTGYAMSANNGLCHRIIIDSQSDTPIDHINNNKLDNRRENLRLISTSDNLKNRRNIKSNKSGVIGVSFSKCKNKWKSHLMINYKQVHLGYFDLFEDAVIARLQGELSYFGEFSPQSYLLENYGLDNPYKDLYSVSYKYNLKIAVNSYLRILKLSNAKSGSGHDCALKGIIVQFDLQYPEYFSPQLQRYKFIDIISSQSKMHKIMSKTLRNEDFAKPLPEQTLDYLNFLIYQGDINEVVNALPSGYLKWMAISSNYLQLKTIYRQRKNHKLSEWREFCKWIETLPMSELITG